MINHDIFISNLFIATTGVQYLSKIDNNATFIAPKAPKSQTGVRKMCGEACCINGSSCITRIYIFAEMSAIIDKLEKVIILSVFNEWLTVKDLGQLDTSFTNASRELFHNLVIASNCQTRHHDDVLATNKSMIVWLLNLKFRKLSLTYDLLNSATEEIFICGDQITSLTIQPTWQPTDDDEIQSNNIGRIFFELRNVTEIAIIGFKYLTFQNVTNLASFGLNSINFTGCEALNDDFLLIVVNACSDLTHVKLSGCHLLTGVSLIPLIQKFGKNLRTLHVAYCHHIASINESAATIIAQECTQLTSLNMSNIMYCMRLALNEIILKNPQIIELFLRDAAVTPDTATAIAQNLSKLKILDCGNAQTLTDDSFAQIANGCKDLVEITWDCFCYQFQLNRVTEQTFINFATHLSNLKVFKFPQQLLTKEVLTQVSVVMSVVDLSDYGSHVVGDIKLVNPDTAPVKTKSKSPVFKLIEPYCDKAHTFISGRTQKSDAVVPFLQIMPNLTKLDLSHTPSLTNKDLIEMSKHVKLLMEFSYDCQGALSRSKFDDTGLIALISANPNLTILNLPYSNLFTDATLGSIGQHCRELKWLNIHFAGLITDEGLISLSACKKLEFLNIAGCGKFTAVGINSIIENCKRLGVFKFLARLIPDFDLNIKAKYQIL